MEGPKLVTEIVYVRLLVACTEPGATLPMPTSATGVTLVITGGVTLLVEFESIAGELTLAMLVSDPLAGAVTTTVRLLTWPLAKFPKLQFTTPLLFTPLPLALTKLTVAGRVSVTTTLPAMEGPKLVTEIVYVRLLVACTEP